MRPPASAVERFWQRLRPRRTVDLWYDPSYRLPFSGLESTGVEPRRAEFVAWYLIEQGLVGPEQLHPVRPCTYARMARVHTEQYLESLSRPETLAQIFAVDPSDVVVDEALHSVRLAVGGTIAAARYALASGRPTMNLQGGFHHARRNGGGGFCAVNDIAIAISTLRRKGVTGRIVVLDLDAHPPDGTADCLQDDPAVWIGSISGSDWGPLPPEVDETLLPPGSGDGVYLEALDALLRRMPSAQLAFVIAGGDILAGDRLGTLAVTMHGIRRRDIRVLAKLGSTPSVWLPAGGYQNDAWRALAGTGLVLAGRPRQRISRRYDPLHARFLAISRSLQVTTLSSDSNELTQEDMDSLFGGASRRESKLLGFYTKQGLEYAFYKYGLIEQIRRLGYENIRVAIDVTGSGDRLRLHGTADGTEHLLVEIVAEKRAINGVLYLFTNWLTLRNPRARFSPLRPQLPGQDTPGLGLAREIAELIALIAVRLGLAGVAFRPAWYHVAYSARYRFRFADPARQGRFEALIRDLKGLPLLEATQAISEGRVFLGDAPYKWEADDMIFPLHEKHSARSPEDQKRLQEERDRTRFTYTPKPGAAEPKSGASGDAM